ncbi:MULTISPECIES: 30S ribosomal protein S9 [Thermodesulfobacterium]|jgi:small subunit ribosomal protein S9|uniref:Small ribosomal subunit protein uS9 n=2 Tax=Thermodesulfobacterium commune TaxID=1741 RepID=A0A075WUZ8_9BACT|nr:MULTISPECIES: 30S ribosomal protein S9 [Thermodesulfobacterium]KUJ97671.1 MAG: 30S ribosomal protein S9 [Thermodesulfobacterium sp. 37_54]KUK19439.1 MAG: 30S ribosomal protein S9 [Thermodesulfobacterium commune]AIH04268.1 30S ribosomal protein S9 [Thermodesulfobacterium commune DSM 2178]KUK37580.1 MAG: 30S ribosomal protein S9 [Thermodesulfobacterium commune]MBZ4682537.1 ribosomal protein [Thermodesulfobacterium sp.]
MERIYATGKRKTAVARVWIYPGTGQIIVNDKPYNEYFYDHIVAEDVLFAPFKITNLLGKFDVKCTVKGGGKAAQAEAIRHGIARALVLYSPDLKVVLKKAGFITRDPREKERKKYGLRGARRGQQYSKR